VIYRAFGSSITSVIAVKVVERNLSYFIDLFKSKLALKTNHVYVVISPLINGCKINS